jgi:hypothetical protein
MVDGIKDYVIKRRTLKLHARRRCKWTGCPRYAAPKLASSQNGPKFEFIIATGHSAFFGFHRFSPKKKREAQALGIFMPMERKEREREGGRGGTVDMHKLFWAQTETHPEFP